MIQRMARENATQRKPDVATLFEAIRAAVEAHGRATGLPEMPFKTEQGQRTDKLRIAPSYMEGSVPPGGILPSQVYTLDGLAKFLGMTKSGEHARDSFLAAFGALDAISGIPAD